MFKKMFGSGDSKKEKEKEKEKKEKKERRREERREEERREEKKHQRKTSSDSSECTRSESKKERPRTKSRSEDAAAKPHKTRPKPAGKTGRRGSQKRKNKVKREIKVDTSKPIEYPCVPEVILEYHKQKAFLKPNEEWLVVEMGEFECLIDSLEIVKIIAKHSKFFELDPPELLEEFFEFVDEVPSYDEVINYDVWQEFRDKRYPC